MRKFLGYLGISLCIGAVAAVFCAYFITRIDPQTRLIYDGFGRPLSGKPFAFGTFFSQAHLWAGWRWFFVDIIIFFSVSGLGGVLMKYGFWSAIKSKPVTAIASDVQQLKGTVEAVEQTLAGCSYSYQIRGEDGQMYTLSDTDGITLDRGKGTSM